MSDSESSEVQVQDDFPYDNDEVVVLRPSDAVVVYKTEDGKESDTPTTKEDGTVHDDFGTSTLDIKTTVGCARQAETIANLMCDAGIENPCPLPNVPHVLLVDIVDIMTEYEKNKPTTTKHTTENGVQTHTEISDVDKKWLDGKDIARVIELIKCADYLNFREALSVLEQHVAENIKGKTPEEIRTLFNIKNDQTPEQQAQIRAENADLLPAPTGNNNNE